MINADKLKGVIPSALQIIQRDRQRESLEHEGTKSTFNRVIQPETLTCNCSSEQLMGDGQVEGVALIRAESIKSSMTFQTRNLQKCLSQTKTEDQAGILEAEVATEQ